MNRQGMVSEEMAHLLLDGECISPPKELSKILHHDPTGDCLCSINIELDHKSWKAAWHAGSDVPHCEPISFTDQAHGRLPYGGIHKVSRIIRCIRKQFWWDGVIHGDLEIEPRTKSSLLK